MCLIDRVKEEPHLSGRCPVRQELQLPSCWPRVVSGGGLVPGGSAARVPGCPGAGCPHRLWLPPAPPSAEGPVLGFLCFEKPQPSPLLLASYQAPWSFCSSLDLRLPARSASCTAECGVLGPLLQGLLGPSCQGMGQESTCGGCARERTGPAVQGRPLSQRKASGLLYLRKCQ